MSDPWAAMAGAAPTPEEIAAEDRAWALAQAADDYAAFVADLAERQAAELAAWVGALEGDGEPAC